MLTSEPSTSAKWTSKMKAFRPSVTRVLSAGNDALYVTITVVLCVTENILPSRHLVGQRKRTMPYHMTKQVVNIWLLQIYSLTWESFRLKPTPKSMSFGGEGNCHSHCHSTTSLSGNIVVANTSNINLIATRKGLYFLQRRYDRQTDVCGEKKVK